jgi:CotH kinase protein
MNCRSCLPGRLVFLTVSCLIACSDVEPTPAQPSDGDAAVDDAATEARPFPDVFPVDDILEVALTLDEDAWDQLRNQGRSLNEVFSGCRQDPMYSLKRAQATLDGETIPLLVRKKGFLGSLSVTKPSLRLELDEQRFRGRKELTLNNNRSDASSMRQCLAYGVFADAGFAAPHCTFARVEVNERPLGIYTHLEAIKAPFLRRFFGSAEGNLYEGNALADFRLDALEYFERKNNDHDPDASDLAAVSEALEIEDDAEMLDALESALDVDQFVRFWATEILVGHWDGYAGNANNFYVYRDPRSDRFVFIPWGTDGAFVETHAFLPPTGRPAVTLAWSHLAGRLYAYQPTRERYYTALRELLEEVWDERRLAKQIEQMVDLLGDSADPEAVDTLRNFIATRRDAIEQELNGPLVPWSIPERRGVVCNPGATSKITASFSTQWGTLESPMPQAGSFELRVGGQQLRLDAAVGAGPDPNSALVRLIGRMADGQYLVVQLDTPALPRETPAEVELHGFETLGVVVVTKGPSTTTTTLGYIGSGSVHFERASNEAGSAIVGSLEAQFTQISASPKP